MKRYSLKELNGNKLICYDLIFNFSCTFMKHHYQFTREFKDANNDPLDFQTKFSLEFEMKKWLVEHHFRSVY